MCVADQVRCVTGGLGKNSVWGGGGSGRVSEKWRTAFHRKVGKPGLVRTSQFQELGEKKNPWVYIFLRERV
jgi:hypothetical protein